MTGETVVHQEYASASPGGRGARLCVAGFFFIGYFVYVRWFVDPELIYHADMFSVGPGWQISIPIYRTGWTFFWEHATCLGGMAKYFASLAAQLLFYPAIGAMILTLLSAVIFVGTLSLGRALDWRGRWVSSYVASLVLLGMAGSYVFELTNLVALAISLSCIQAYFWWAGRKRGALASAVVFLLISLPLSWAVGGAYLLFAICCSLVEAVRRRRMVIAGGYLLFALLLLPAVTALSLMNQPDDGFLFTWGKVVGNSLQSAIPSTIYTMLIALMFVWDLTVRKRVESPRVSASAPASRHENGLCAAAATALLVGTTVLAGFGFLDREARTLLRANYYARTGMWAELLRELESQPLTAIPAGLSHDVNRALFETGQLGNRMFSFPQNPELLLQVREEAVPHRGCHEVLLQLGFVNEAEHVAYESLEVTGPRPYVLRELAIINIVKERPAAARVFLNALSQDIVHGAWARECLKKLRRDPRLDGDPHVIHIRSAMMRKDQVAVPIREQLKDLVAENVGNRMAFEYLMAHFLLTCQLDKVAENIGALRDLGYERIPEHYAEAILLDWQLNRKEPDMCGWKIEARTFERFNKFLQLTRGTQRDSGAIYEVAKGTYYQYFFAAKQQM